MLNEQSELNWIENTLSVQGMYTVHILYAIHIYMYKYITALSH